MTCPICKGEGWCCENHPDVPWNNGDPPCCGGAGMPCKCNPTAEPIPGTTVIWSLKDGYAH